MPKSKSQDKPKASKKDVTGFTDDKIKDKVKSKSHVDDCKITPDWDVADEEYALFPPSNLLAAVLQGGTGGYLDVEGFGAVEADATKDYLVHCKGRFCVGGKGAHIKWVTEDIKEEDFIT